MQPPVHIVSIPLNPKPYLTCDQIKSAPPQTNSVPLANHKLNVSNGIQVPKPYIPKDWMIIEQHSESIAVDASSLQDDIHLGPKHHSAAGQGQVGQRRAGQLPGRVKDPMQAATAATPPLAHRVLCLLNQPDIGPEDADQVGVPVLREDASAAAVDVT